MNFNNMRKKTLSIVLVVMMTFMMATVAFGATVKDATVANKVYTYDGKNLTVATGTDLDMGEALYIKVDGIGTDVTDIKDYRVDAKFTSGKNVVSGVKFGVVRDAGVDQLVVKIGVLETFEKKDVKLEGIVTITARGTSLVNGATKATVDVLGTLSYGAVVTATEYFNVTTPFVNFDDCKEVELNFVDGVYFTVNARFQDDLFLRYNNSFDKVMQMKYEDADLTFVGFDGANKTFRKEGVLTIPYDMDDTVPFIYERTANGLMLIKGAYDKDEGAFKVKTKTLGNYVISNVELKNTVEAGPVKNPDTGANDMVGIAVAVAVVSLMAGMALSVKKSK